MKITEDIWELAAEQEVAEAIQAGMEKMRVNLLGTALTSKQRFEQYFRAWF